MLINVSSHFQGFDLFLTFSLIIAYVSARPHSNFHSRFTQPNYNFGFNFSPHDFPSNYIDFTYPIPGFGRALEPPEAMWPLGVFLPPEFDNARGHYSPDFSNGVGKLNSILQICHLMSCHFVLQIIRIHIC